MIIDYDLVDLFVRLYNTDLDCEFVNGDVLAMISRFTLVLCGPFYLLLFLSLVIERIHVFNVLKAVLIHVSLCKIFSSIHVLRTSVQKGIKFSQLLMHTWLGTHLARLTTKTFCKKLIVSKISAELIYHVSDPE